MGIHGEPGVRRGKLQPANAIADQLLDPILADLSLGRGERIAVLVNSLGATPAEELFILFDRIAQPLRRRGHRHRLDAGRPLRHLDGDGRRIAHRAAARRRARGLSRRARRLRVLEGLSMPLDHRQPARRRSPASARKLETEHQRLTELDGKLGDGDLGVTLLKAFRALDEIKAACRPIWAGAAAVGRRRQQGLELELRHADGDRRCWRSPRTAKGKTAIEWCEIWRGW